MLKIKAVFADLLYAAGSEWHHAFEKEGSQHGRSKPRAWVEKTAPFVPQPESIADWNDNTLDEPRRINSFPFLPFNSEPHFERLQRCVLNESSKNFCLVIKMILSLH